MPFNYRIHFVGLVCFIRQNERPEYVVALPDGVAGTAINPCTGKTIHPHIPYLIIPKKDVITSQAMGKIVNECFVVDLRAAKSLTFATASSSATDPVNDDDTHKNKNGLVWREIDPKFEPDTRTAIVTVPLKQGELVARRLRGEESKGLAVIHEVTVKRPTSGGFDVIAGRDTIRVAAKAEIVVANVAPEWIDYMDYKDDDDHFFLYYGLDKGNGECKKPKLKTPPPTNSDHPYLAKDRGLRIACSNTTYP